MKAIVYRSFGSPDLLNLEEVPMQEPGDGEIVVRVRAASVNPLDWHMLRGTPRMMRLAGDLRKYRPMRPGRDVAGVVQAVGRKVERFRPGDEVFGAAQGAFADYVRGRESEFVAKPTAAPFDEAAALPIAGLTALQGLRDCGRLSSGARVLVNGASGGIGTFAVQLARLSGAEVTAVCSADAAELVRRLGAHHVVDYRTEDFTAEAREYDLILDLVGNHAFRRLRRVLASSGRIVAVGGGGPGGRRLGRWMARTVTAVAASRFRRERIVMCVSKMSIEDLAALAALVEEGRLTVVIDRRYPLEQAADAMRQVAEGHLRGKVVLEVGREEPESEPRTAS